MIEVAKRAAVAAGEISLSLRGKKLSVERKGTIDDFATEADKASEQEILRILQAEFSKHNFLAEETGRIERGSDYTWVIDPLDGTGVYFSGLPTFGVSVGLLKESKPFLGVLNFPVLKSIYWAQKGKGAYFNGTKISVNREKELAKIRVGFDLAWMGEREEEIRSLFLPLVDKVLYTPILGCTIAGLAYVAQGIYGAYIHWAYPWDFVAGAAIIEEAGGMISDKKGKPIDWSKDDMLVIASNGLVHDEILSLIK